MQGLRTVESSSTDSMSLQEDSDPTSSIVETMGPSRNDTCVAYETKVLGRNGFINPLLSQTIVPQFIQQTLVGQDNASGGMYPTAALTF